LCRVAHLTRPETFLWVLVFFGAYPHLCCQPLFFLCTLMFQVHGSQGNGVFRQANSSSAARRASTLHVLCAAWYLRQPPQALHEPKHRVTGKNMKCRRLLTINSICDPLYSFHSISHFTKGGQKCPNLTIFLHEIDITVLPNT
jgi:hypothetical protein